MASWPEHGRETMSTLAIVLRLIFFVFFGCLLIFFGATLAVSPVVLGWTTNQVPLSIFLFLFGFCFVLLGAGFIGDAHIRGQASSSWKNIPTGIPMRLVYISPYSAGINDYVMLVVECLNRRRFSSSRLLSFNIRADKLESLDFPENTFVFIREGRAIEDTAKLKTLPVVVKQEEAMDVQSEEASATA